ncbi:hypothetical protein Agub_g3848, partial [Astrephomene gubernaculifera]
MSSDLSCVEEWYEDNSRAGCGARLSNSSLASYATDDWLTTSSLLSLECSEDMAMEDACDVDACEEPVPCAAMMLPGFNSFKGNTPAYFYEPVHLQGLRELIRSELLVQAQLYGGVYDNNSYVHGSSSPPKPDAAGDISGFQEANSSCRGYCPDVNDGAGRHGGLVHVASINVTATTTSRPLNQSSSANDSSMEGITGTSSQPLPAAATAAAIPPAAASSQPSSSPLCGWPVRSLGDRQLLVGWMRELAAAGGLQRDTLWGAVGLMDRFVLASSSGSSSPVSAALSTASSSPSLFSSSPRDHEGVCTTAGPGRGSGCGPGSGSECDGGFFPPQRMLQLLAIACMSVAMKFEE